MKWLTNRILGFKDAVCVGAETDEQSLEAGIKLLDEKYPKDEYEEVREKEFYCGLCGWIPVSQYKEHISRH